MKKVRHYLLFFLIVSGTVYDAFSQAEFAVDFKKKLDSLRIAGNFPGLSAAVYYGTNNSFTAVSGYADIEKSILLQPGDCLMQGSVGKTYVSAMALQLVKNGKINLDKKVSTYLGHYAWYYRIPNATDITVRMLMNHTSGVMRYEFKEQFTKDLTFFPDKVWAPEDLLRYILDEKAPFKAGEGWDYSDTNYILLGMIIEQVTGEKYYDLLRDNILVPLTLLHTFPSENKKLKGLVQGYAGTNNEFGGKDKVIGEDGLFIVNPQFEWTGGGIYSTTEDLAKWGKQLYEGQIVDTTLLLSAAVPAKLGRDVKYGLGVIIRPTSLGVAYGHSGFFPGYMTEMLYFPRHNMCVAIQTNSSDFKNLRIPLLKCLMEIASVVKRN